MASTQSKVSLKKWFANKVYKPSLILLILIIFVQAFYFYSIFNNYHSTQNRRMDRLVKTVELGLMQRNVNIVERLMETAYIETHARFIGICDNDSANISLPGNIDSCPQNESLSVFDVYKDLLVMGTGGKRLIVIYPLLPPLREAFFSFIVFLFATLGFLFIISRFILDLNKGILSPLSEDIFSDKPIFIDEIENIRLANKAHQETLKKKAISDAVADVSHQVAHDIRSPIGSIGVAIENFKNKPEQAMDLIRRAHERIKGIVDDLESVDKTSGEVNKDTSAETLWPLLEKVVGEKSQEKNNYPIKLSTSLAVNKRDALAMINKSDFARMISNLINNSVEASEVSLPIFLTYELDEKYHKIEIQDQGAGIPESIQGRLFEKHVTSGKDSGQGLGLYSTQKILQAWRGDINLVKTNSQGTTFRLVIPIYKN
jgi:signal transduction histidine kinase